jgi:hypothetical protein
VVFCSTKTGILLTLKDIAVTNMVAVNRDRCDAADILVVRAYLSPSLRDGHPELHLTTPLASSLRRFHRLVHYHEQLQPLELRGLFVKHHASSK